MRREKEFHMLPLDVKIAAGKVTQDYRGVESSYSMQK